MTRNDDSFRSLWTDEGYRARNYISWWDKYNSSSNMYWTGYTMSEDVTKDEYKKLTKPKDRALLFKPKPPADTYWTGGNLRVASRDESGDNLLFVKDFYTNPPSTSSSTTTEYYNSWKDTLFPWFATEPDNNFDQKCVAMYPMGLRKYGGDQMRLVNTVVFLNPALKNVRKKWFRILC